jgi:hypothetical protein
MTIIFQRRKFLLSVLLQSTGLLRSSVRNQPLKMDAAIEFYAEKAEKRELFEGFLV